MTNHAFPKETVDRVYAEADKLTKYSKKPIYLASSIIKGFSDSYYSFRDALSSGKYAEYYHERLANGNLGVNCTTVIPEVYLYCERLGLKPEIIQFTGMREVKSRKEVDDTGHQTVHFAITVDVKKKHRYLLDPFWSRFGPILTQEDHTMIVGRHKEYNRIRREFKTATIVPVSEFAEMMERMHHPAGSLEMLVAGQRIYKKKVIDKTSCNLMVYYDSNKEIVSTRLEIPQTAISAKAIYCYINLAPNGGVKKTSLDLFMAKGFRWVGLEEEKLVAHTNLPELYQLRRELSSLPGFSTTSRIGTALRRNFTPSLEVLANNLLTRMKNTDHIQRQIYARTLYEMKRPDVEYLFSNAEKEKLILELNEKHLELRDRIQPLEDQLWSVNWKLQVIDEKEKRRLNKEKEELSKEKSKLITEMDSLNYLRNDNKQAFYRRMDQVLFAKRLEKASTNDLRRMVKEANLNYRIGYLALVADFIPFATKGRKYLILKEFMAPLQEKITAKHKK